MFQLLIYPMLDDRNVTRSSYEITDVGIWNRATNIGGWQALHPFLAHYQGSDCSPTGTTGTWNAASGASGTD